jgi:hypothetical protein
MAIKVILLAQYSPRGRKETLCVHALNNPRTFCRCLWTGVRYVSHRHGSHYQCKTRARSSHRHHPWHLPDRQPSRRAQQGPGMRLCLACFYAFLSLLFKSRAQQKKVGRKSSDGHLRRHSTRSRKEYQSTSSFKFVFYF